MQLTWPLRQVLCELVVVGSGGSGGASVTEAPDGSSVAPTSARPGRAQPGTIAKPQPVEQ